MSYRAKLNSVFSGSLFRPLIPMVNRLITAIKRNTTTSTSWDSLTKRYYIREKGVLIHVDTIPYWACSKAYLRSAVFRINLVGIQIHENATIVDIGAGTGTEAVVFSDLVSKNGKVYAIEAHPETYYSLEQLVSKGKYDNVVPCQMAIGNKEGVVFIDSLEDHEKNSVLNGEVDNGTSTPVRMMSLDEFVSLNGIKEIDFLKVNIEGAEMLMIEGMKESVHIIKNAAISCHDFLKNDVDMPIMSAVRAFFEENGFKVNHYPHEHPVMNSWLYMTKENA